MFHGSAEFQKAWELGKATESYSGEIQGGYWLAGRQHSEGWSSPQSSGIPIPSCLTTERRARIPLGRQPLLLMEPGSFAGTSPAREGSTLLGSGQLLSFLSPNPWPDTTLSSCFFGLLYSGLPSTAVFFITYFLHLSPPLSCPFPSPFSWHHLRGLLACTSSTWKSESPSW